jgi:hypothetical protein
MAKALQALFLAASVAAALPASAQGYHGPPPRSYPQYRPRYEPPPQNALRLEIGGATMAARYCPEGNAGPCFSGDPWGALTLDANVDLGLGRGPVSLVFGVREALAPYYSGAPSIFEPWLGLSFKFMRNPVVEPRLVVGGAVMIGDNDDVGGSFRIGGGLSLFNFSRIGLAVDLMVDVGRLGDVTVTQVQLALGPEFRF